MGPSLRTRCHRKTIVTDASLTGCWEGPHLLWHINCLEMRAVLELRHFLPDVRAYHMLVWTDTNSSFLHKSIGWDVFMPLFRLVQQILLWADCKLISLGAVYIPEHLNTGADILTRPELRPAVEFPSQALSSHLTIYSVINRYLTMAMVMLSCNNILSKQLRQILVTHFFQYH